ncbi:MAG: hypothetical protein Q9163_004846 [Psora crenata]
MNLSCSRRMYGLALAGILSFACFSNAKPYPQQQQEEQGNWNGWSASSESSTALEGPQPTAISAENARTTGTTNPGEPTGTGNGTVPTTAAMSGNTALNPSEQFPASPLGGTGPSGAAGLPANCFQPNGIGVGWLPNDVDISVLQSQVSSSPPCTYGAFAQITSGDSMPDEQIGSGVASAAQAGTDTVYQIALQPWVPFSAVSAPAVAASMVRLSSQVPGQIWLRLAHEINWYIDTNPDNQDPQNKYHGSPAEFKAMWTAIAAAVDRSKVKMFWTPVPPFGGDTVQSLHDKWYPGDDAVDVVGLDAYGQSTTGTFEEVVGPFCRLYSHKPLHLGETGWLGGGTPDQKRWWLGQVSGPQAKTVCPNYLGFSWFEYNKPSEGDFRIVTGDAGNLAKSVLGG